MQIISKKEAKEQGLIFYYTGKACKQGHLSIRLVAGGACRVCKNNYYDEYKLKNPDKCKESIKRCQAKTYSTEKRREQYIKNIKSEMCSAAKYRAKLKKIDFNISKEDIIINEYCPVLNIPLDRSTKDNVPTLDRLDNSKGYTKDNIVVISFKANRLKNNATVDDISKILYYMKTTKI